MKAKELRIGNLVFHKNYPDRWYPVQHIVCNTSDDVVYKISHGTFNRRLFDPIPITPEALERLGFVATKKAPYTYWRRTNSAGEYLDWLVFRAHDIASWGVVGREMDGYFLSYTEKGVKVSYVHQLQNLYFALTGEELTLKEDVK